MKAIIWISMVTLCLMLCSLCRAEEKPKAPETDVPANSDEEEVKAFAAFNAFRARCGLPPCVMDANLQIIAKNHSARMNNRRRLFHSGTPGVAENVYMGSSSGAHAVNAWINSAGHRANMMGRYSKVGIGRVGIYHTMILQ